MGRSKAAILLAKAVADLAHEQNPEARVEAKREGLDVGVRVLYDFEGNGRTGVVRAVHHKGVDIEQNAAGLIVGGERIIVRDDKLVPYANIRSILGPGELTERIPEVKRPGTPPPERTEGYANCDIGDCSNTPYKVYLMRKTEWNEEHTQGELGPPHLVAVCRDHDEKYEQPECKMMHDHTKDKGAHCVCTQPAHFPEIWNLGVTFDEWMIPKPEKVEEPKVVSQRNNLSLDELAKVLETELEWREKVDG